MSTTPRLRRLAFALLSSCTLSTAFLAAPLVLGTTSVAQAQVPAEFESALEPYGEWVRHPRWGMVWMPYDRPPGWRPYTEGHWVYTDDWGWYWISEGEEQDWGWVAYHYGRWVLDSRMGWLWVPGEEWAPAWVDWRRGGEYVHLSRISVSGDRWTSDQLSSAAIVAADARRGVCRTRAGARRLPRSD